MNDYGSVDTLVKMNDTLTKDQALVEDARIHNPAEEIRDALKEFAVTRLRRVEEDAAFSDVVKAALRQRIPEATFKELMDLLKITTEANNQTAESLINMFNPANSDKTVLERLESNNTENIAAKMYTNIDDKKKLQALTYLNMILSKANQEIEGASEVRVEKEGEAE